MSAIIFIGDELTAAGFRLAGVTVITPTRDGEAEALANARGIARIVLLGSDVAARLPAREVETAATSLDPLVLIVPDILGLAPPPDLARRLKATLGLEV